MDTQSRLTVTKRLAIAVNPNPTVPYKLRVLKSVRIAEQQKFRDEVREWFEDWTPEGWSREDWLAALDALHNDPTTAIVRGVFYTVGDIIEPSRFEAAALLAVFPDAFEAADELTATFVEAVQRGEA